MTTTPSAGPTLNEQCVDWLERQRRYAMVEGDDRIEAICKHMLAHLRALPSPATEPSAADIPADRREVADTGEYRYKPKMEPAAADRREAIQWIITVRNGQRWAPSQEKRFDAAIALLSTEPSTEPSEGDRWVAVAPVLDLIAHVQNFLRENCLDSYASDLEEVAETLRLRPSPVTEKELAAIEWAARHSAIVHREYAPHLRSLATRLQLDAAALARAEQQK